MVPQSIPCSQREVASLVPYVPDAGDRDKKVCCGTSCVSVAPDSVINGEKSVLGKRILWPLGSINALLKPRLLDEGGDDVSLEVLNGELKLDAVVTTEKDCEGPWFADSEKVGGPEMVVGR